MSSKLESSKAGGIHFQLGRLTGEWEGTTSVWFEPDKVADQSPIHGTMRPILDGRFILHEYRSSFGGKPKDAPSESWITIRDHDPFSCYYIQHCILQQNGLH